MRAGAAKLAKHLRRKPTDAERALWMRLRNRQIDGWKFRRQIPFGPFVLDFYCPDAKLAIEVDGGQHADLCKDHDERRTAFLAGEGVMMLRFWNGEVLTDVEGVLTRIYKELGERPAPSPGAKRAGLSPEGRGVQAKLIDVVQFIQPSVEKKKI